MASSPQTPSNGGLLPAVTPSTSLRFDKQHRSQSPSPLPPQQQQQLRLSTEDVAMGNDPVSSPFVSNTKDVSAPTQENMSPTKSRHSRILSGAELSPLKILSARDDNARAEGRSPERSTSAQRSPRKPSPEKRFPVRVNSGTCPSPEPQIVVHEQDMTLEEAIKQNKDLESAIKIFEDEDTMMLDEADNSAADGHLEDEAAGPDDTMVSTFSTFSAVPNMTMFARIGHSPSKFANIGGATPNGSTRSRGEPSPPRTTRPPVIHEAGNSSGLLMDFTEQLSGFTAKYGSQSPSRRTGTTPNKNTVSSTPLRRHSNLLDFDIPPLPTPRSIPTVTPRELETLKSSFLSEISSLKASLSGKEAEALSLKTAVADAEKRVGECMEQLREAQAIKDAMAEEKENWERRGREMETVLRKVKEEIVLGQRERDSLESRLDESEKRREAAEMMAQEAESKMAGMRAGKAMAEDRSPEKAAKSPGSRDVEIAVERVARELHALYKSKHETKVAALKKSYENRWEKKVRELEGRLEEMAEENDKLRLGRDATMTKVDSNQSVIDEERRDQAVKDSAQIKQMTAEIDKLEAVVKSVKADNGELRQLLERERIEKGELVQLAEEMMQMQTMQSFIQQEEAKVKATPIKPKTPAAESYRNSIGRAPTLKAPGSIKKPSESRIGAIGHERNRNGGSAHSGLARPGMGGPGSRSGIMSSIEKMGNYRGRE